MMIRRFLLHKVNRFPFRSVLTCLCILAGMSVFSINLMFQQDTVMENILLSIFCVCMLVICFCLGILLVNAITAIFVHKYYNELFKYLFDLDEEDEEYIKNPNNVVEFKRYR